MSSHRRFVVSIGLMLASATAFACQTPDNLVVNCGFGTSLEGWARIDPTESSGFRR
jgi:hypothetical protein